MGKKWGKSNLLSLLMIEYLKGGKVDSVSNFFYV